jgi:hypothetical protein
VSRTLDIGLDIDGPIYPYPSVLGRWCERAKGLPAGTFDDHPLTWAWFKDQWGMEVDEYRELHAAGVRAGVVFSKGGPVEGSVAAIRRLHLAGHRIHYVTNRAFNGVDEQHAYDVTHRWLHDHGFVVDSLTITADKASVPTDIFLDDSPENIAALEDAGHPLPVLWDRPYNRHPSVGGLRVNDWHEFELVVRMKAVGPTHTPLTTKKDA